MVIGGISGNTTSWAAQAYGVGSAHPVHAGYDNRTVVYGNADQIREAQNYLRPDWYRFVDVAATGGIAPETATSSIVLGDTPALGTHYRIRPGMYSGNPHESLSKAVLSYAASSRFGSRSGERDFELCTIYITGEVPPEHKLGPYGLPEGYSALLGGGFRTPEQWLELKRQEVAAEGLFMVGAAVPGGSLQQAGGCGNPGGAPGCFSDVLEVALAALPPAGENGLVPETPVRQDSEVPGQGGTGGLAQGGGGWFDDLPGADTIMAGHALRQAEALAGLILPEEENKA